MSTSPSEAKIRVCFVCLGNICRSPTAEGVFRKLVEDAKLAHRFEIDSAGTGNWHVGELSDPRTRKAAEARGIALTHRARQLGADDFDRFDHIVVMDASNWAHVARLAPTEAARAKISMMRAHEDKADPVAEVPDPYFGDESHFDEVLDICESACAGLLRKLHSPR
ncbi:MAG: low molecular weight phosphotyrosine protein phosphatase [Sandaracinaceae bacterium]|jgi:protein-tyrosine phosphatase|nr:low molecular weight phosphotyrosine protein phosphatase [Sandaracinaceae bacterium]